MKDKIDWKRKLSSRKFWAAVIGFVTPVMVAAGATDIQVDQTVAIITGCSVLVAYILAEGFTDSKHVGEE